MADNTFQLSSPVTQSLNALKNCVPCDVCNRYYVDEVVLEHHKINDSHFKCCYCDELTTFSSRSGLSSHHNATHATRLSAITQNRSIQQVQLMPVTCNLTPSRNENFSLPSAEPRFIIRNVRSIDPPDEQPHVSSVPIRMPVKRSMPLSKTAPSPLKRRVLENTERNFYNGGNSPMCNITRQYTNKKTTDERNTEANIPVNKPNRDTYKADEVKRMPMALNSAVMITPTTNKSNPVGYKADEVNRVPIALNSAVTLIPTGTKKQTTPAGRPSGYDVSNNKITTADLTEHDTSDKFSRVKKFTCSMCKKVFSSQDSLNQHMTIHRNYPRQLSSFSCTLCVAKFSTQQDLNQHKSTFHRDDTNVRNIDCTLGNAVIPVAANLNEINRFRSIGVRHFIQLTATVDRDGYIDLPITGVSGNTPGSSSTNTGFLRVGPLVNMKKLNK